MQKGAGACAFVCLFTSLVFLGMSIAMLVIIQTGLIQDALDDKVRKETTLEPGHETYRQWLNPTAGMEKDFYIFNLTNPEEFAGGSKPRFEELGPYHYREIRKKTVLDRSNGTITYVMNRTFHFEQVGDYSESDVITTINFAYVAAIHLAELNSLEGILQTIINSNVRPLPELVIQTTVHELIWEYTDPLLVVLNQAGLIPSPYIHLQLNDSYSDRELPSIVHSGTKDSLKRARFIQWANLTELPFWMNEASFINKSTEGLLFHAILDQNEMLEVFISDTNRTFHLKSKEEVSIRGIDAYRFRTIEGDFRPDTNYLTGNNTPNGLIYLGVLQHDAPVYGSKPHFLDCDESLLEAVEGISPPDKRVHDIIVDVEPVTGSTINVHNRLQVLFNVSQTSQYFEPFNNITSVYFPLFYVDEHAMLDDELKSKLNDEVFTPTKVVKAISWVIFGMCFLISLLTGCCTIGWCIKLNKKQGKRSGYRELFAPERNTNS
ncbi:lysosome membrane protein 2-like [Dysidea avara]|uniref:lysosome membrane protein 2-like n=1 Tax=Dysidea avara TaxID=196820 RepID=UPI003327AD8A